MSPNITTEAEMRDYLAQMNFTGGIPTHKDFAPSIVFLIFYIALIPLVVYRVAARSSRTMTLIRPVIFVLVRIATFVLRTYMSKTPLSGKNVLIAELICVSVGFLFLISPIVTLWKRQIEGEVPPEHQPQWMRVLTKAAHLLIIGAIVTAIIGSSMIGKDDVDMDTVRKLRRISYILSFVVVIVVLVGVVATHVHLRLQARPTVFLLTVLVMLFIVAIYRLLQLYNKDPNSTIRSITSFYILQGLFEAISCAMLFAINMNTWFPEVARPVTQSRPEEIYQYSYKPNDV